MLKITRIKKESVPVYDLTVPETSAFFANGILVHNCTESFSNVMPDKLGHVCNLASINLGNINSLEELADVAGTAAKLLDYGISLTSAPSDITALHNGTFRTIGIGIMGLHDYLAKNNLNYRNLDIIREISEIIELNAAMASTELARVYGSFTAFSTSTWASGEQTAHFASHSTERKAEWAKLQELINQNGMRNSQLTSPAPTTSSSIYQEASASFLPSYSAFFAEDNKNGSLIVAAKFLKENPLGYGKSLSKFSATEIIDVACELQKFIDTGISMELMFDQNKDGFNAKQLYDAIHYAHSKGIKTIYYIRSIKKNETLNRGEEACVACAG